MVKSVARRHRSNGRRLQLRSREGGRPGQPRHAGTSRPRLAWIPFPARTRKREAPRSPPRERRCPPPIPMCREVGSGPRDRSPQARRRAEDPARIPALPHVPEAPPGRQGAGSEVRGRAPSEAQPSRSRRDASCPSIAAPTAYPNARGRRAWRRLRSRSRARGRIRPRSPRRRAFQGGPTSLAPFSICRPCSARRSPPRPGRCVRTRTSNGRTNPMSLPRRRRERTPMREHAVPNTPDHKRARSRERSMLISAG